MLWNDMFDPGTYSPLALVHVGYALVPQPSHPATCGW